MPHPVTVPPEGSSAPSPRSGHTRHRGHLLWTTVLISSPSPSSAAGRPVPGSGGDGGPERGGAAPTSLTPCRPEERRACVCASVCACACVCAYVCVPGACSNWGLGWAGEKEDLRPGSTLWWERLPAARRGAPGAALPRGRLRSETSVCPSAQGEQREPAQTCVLGVWPGIGFRRGAPGGTCKHKHAGRWREGAGGYLSCGTFCVKQNRKRPRPRSPGGGPGRRADTHHRRHRARPGSRLSRLLPHTHGRDSRTDSKAGVGLPSPRRTPEGGSSRCPADRL